MTQSNLAASSASASNTAATQLAAVQQALPPPPVPPSVPVVVPPMPVFSMPPIPLPPAVDVQRELAGALPPPAAAAPSQVDDSSPHAVGTERSGPVRQRPALRRHTVVQTRTLVRLESRAFTRVVVVEASRARARHAAATEHRAARETSRPLPSSPRAPFPPSTPAAAGAFGASAHGGGSSALTVSLSGALTFLVFALLSSILPTSLPGRRRLSDDRHARPG